MGRLLIVLLLVSAVLAQGASTKSKKTESAVSVTGCGDLLIEPGAEISELGHFQEVYSLSDLLSGDPAKNLAFQHPTMMMNAYQKAWAIIRHYGFKDILDPDYRVERTKIYHAFAKPVVRGVQIIGQYVPVDSMVTFIREGAAGSNRSKVLSITGPAGTGKTEFLKVLHLRRAVLSRDNPDFKEHRFRWVNLHTIPSLAPLQDISQWGQPFPHQMGRSPIVLLTRAMQNRLIKLTQPAVEKLTGFDPQPFVIPDPHTKAIIELILAHHFPDKTPNEREYLDALSNYVEIYRFVVDSEQPPMIIRNQGRDIEWSNLFMAEDPARKLVYGAGHALTYDYSGLILQTDGFGFLGDEFFRQVVGFRDSMLEVGQNRVVQRGGAPAALLDAFMVIADNDQSKKKAMEESAADAQMDRAANIPMRSSINPYLIAKTALAMAMQEWGPSKFTMVDLTDKAQKRVPADVNVIFPDLDEVDHFPSIDGRYAIYCKLGSGHDVLIAPRTLYLLGTTIAASRLVVDSTALVKHLKEFDILKSGTSEYTNPITRLQVILGQMPASDALLTELTKVKYLLEEGSEGISARSAQTWFLTALGRAAENENTLTPALLNDTFEKMMDRKDFLNKNLDVRARWVALNELVKAGLLLPSLTEDVLMMLSQRTDIDSLYAELEAELLTLFRDAKATKYEAQGKNHMVEIDFHRLEAVRRIYKRLTGRNLEAGEVADFRLIPARKPEDRHAGLLKAIQTWLLEKELSSHALDQYLNYFETSNGTDDVRRRGDRAKIEMTSHGYNLRALLEAMSMARDLMRDQEQRDPNGSK